MARARPSYASTTTLPWCVGSSRRVGGWDRAPEDGTPLEQLIKRKRANQGRRTRPKQSRHEGIAGNGNGDDEDDDDSGDGHDAADDDAKDDQAPAHSVHPPS
jgi:hypothetical protein